MADSSAESASAGFGGDELFVWSCALNVDDPVEVEWGTQTLSNAATDQIEQHRTVVVRYIRYVLAELAADPERLVAVRDSCRTKCDALDRAGADEKDDHRPATYRRAAALAEAALRMVIAARADADSQARTRLLESVRADLDPAPMRPTRWERLRQSRPGRWTRRLSLRWWARRWAVRRVELVPKAGAFGDVMMFEALLDGERIGRLSYQVCRTCRRARVGKASVDSDWQGVGLGTRLVLAARREAPDYAWSTTMHYYGSGGFWARMGRVRSRPWTWCSG